MTSEGATEQSQPNTRITAKYHIKVGETVHFPAHLETMGEVEKERIEKYRPLSEEETELVRSWVLYKDDKLIALNKPPGLAVQGTHTPPHHKARKEFMSR